MDIKHILLTVLFVAMASTVVEAGERHGYRDRVDQYSAFTQNKHHKVAHAGRHAPRQVHYRAKQTPYFDHRHHYKPSHRYGKGHRHGHYSKRKYYYRPHHDGVRRHYGSRYGHHHNNPLPVIAGATIGGVIGHEIGKNNHNAQAGVVIGGLVGAVIGHELGHKHKKKHRRF